MSGSELPDIPSPSLYQLDELRKRLNSTLQCIDRSKHIYVRELPSHPNLITPEYFDEWPGTGEQAKTFKDAMCRLFWVSLSCSCVHEYAATCGLRFWDAWVSENDIHESEDCDDNNKPVAVIAMGVYRPPPFDKLESSPFWGDIEVYMGHGDAFREETNKALAKIRLGVQQWFDVIDHRWRALAEQTGWSVSNPAIGMHIRRWYELCTTPKGREENPWDDEILQQVHIEAQAIATASATTAHQPTGDNDLKQATADDDGPCPPDAFILDGKRIQITALPFKLLSHIWEHNGKCKVQNAIASVWGRDDVTDKALDSAKRRANAALLEANTGAQIRLCNGFLVLDRRPQDLPKKPPPT